MSITNLLRVGRLDADALPLEEFLANWKCESDLHANFAGRLVSAIGAPETEAASARMQRIFAGHTVPTYKPFADLVGIEVAIHKVVQFLTHAAHGMEQEKQIMYLLGPPGSGKSTILARLMRLAEETHVWVLGVKNTEAEGGFEVSPVFENPLGLFDSRRHGAFLERTYGIPRARVRGIHTQWAARKLRECEGDATRFFAVRVQPTLVSRTCLARVEPGDDSSAHAGALIGMTHREGGSTQYEYSGGLNRTTQGLLEMVEMFSGSDKLFQALRGATQDRCYAGMGSAGVLPYEGVIAAHSNEPDWKKFLSEAKNSGLVDRICVIEVPYCIRFTEEVALYERAFQESGYATKSCVPGSLRLAGLFALSTRVAGENRIKRIYELDGEPSEGGKNRGTEDLLRDHAWREGMEGVSLRAMLKWLPELANKEGIDPVTVLERLRRLTTRTQELKYFGRTVSDILKKDIEPECVRLVSRMMHTAYYEDFLGLAKKKYAAYLERVDAVLEGTDYKDPDTDTVLSTEIVESELEKLENLMGVLARDRHEFRKNITKESLRFYSHLENVGRDQWDVLDQKVRDAFEKSLLVKEEELVERMRLGKRSEAKKQKEHDDFIARLCNMGCTMGQAQALVLWYIDRFEKKR